MPSNHLTSRIFWHAHCSRDNCRQQIYYCITMASASSMVLHVCDLAFFSCEVKGVKLYQLQGRIVCGSWVYFEREPGILEYCELQLSLSLAGCGQCGKYVTRPRHNYECNSSIFMSKKWRIYTQVLVSVLCSSLLLCCAGYNSRYHHYIPIMN